MKIEMNKQELKMTKLKVGTKLSALKMLKGFIKDDWDVFAIDMGSKFEIIDVFPTADGPTKYRVMLLKFTRGHTAEFKRRKAQQAPAGAEFDVKEEFIEKHCEVLGE